MKKQNNIRTLSLIMAFIIMFTALLEGASLNVKAAPIEQDGKSGLIVDESGDGSLPMAEGTRISTYLKQEEFFYTGSEIRPKVKVTCYYQPFGVSGLREGSQNKVVLKENTDYVLTYENNIEAGKGKVTITGIGIYYFQHEREFTIYKRNASKLKLQKIPDIAVTGNDLTEAIKDRVLVYDRKTKVDPSDYEISIEGDTTKEGQVSVTIKASPEGNYRGEIKKNTVNVNICSKEEYAVSGNSVSENVIASLKKNKTYTYTGSEIRPAIKIKQNGKRVKKKNYVLVYENNINAGQATIKVYGINELHGELATVNFTINPADITKLKVVKPAVREYRQDLSDLIPVVKYKKLYLNKGTDYTFTYTDLKSDEFTGSLKDQKYAVATIAIHPSVSNNNFVDNSADNIGKRIDFKIKRINIGSGLTVNTLGLPNSISKNGIDGVSLILDGEPDAEHPVVAVVYLGTQLQEGVDYTVTYKIKENRSTGYKTIKAKIKGIGLFTGKRKISWTV